MLRKFTGFIVCQEDKCHADASLRGKWYWYGVPTQPDDPLIGVFDTATAAQKHARSICGENSRCVEVQPALRPICIYCASPVRADGDKARSICLACIEDECADLRCVRVEEGN